MKKAMIVLFVLASLLFCSFALGEAYVLDPIYAAVDVPSQYVVLTPDNLDSYGTWLEARGKNTETVLNDFQRRGVLIQAWDEENNRIFELRASQTETT